MTERRDRSEPESLPGEEAFSEEESRAARTLRESLADGTEDPDGLASLARSLGTAHAPKGLGAGEHRVLVERALGVGMVVHRGGMRSVRRPGKVVPLFAAAATGLALAAGMTLLLRGPPGEISALPSGSLIVSRSTEALFREPIEVGKGSARIDRIVLARAADLRENRFRRWGVR